MSHAIVAEISELVAKNLRKRLYVALMYPVVSTDQIVPIVPAHLRYMAENEDQVFISGPFIAEDLIVGEGMTILYADDEASAARFMDNEPLIKQGLRRYELKLWEVREGTIKLSAILSQSTFTLG
jgi:uncharacterized protein YciI